MHPAKLYRNGSFIVDLAMGQIPRFTERISGIIVKMYGLQCLLE